MNVQSYRPLAVVTFLTEQGELVARATGDPSSILDNDIVSITTNRDLQADSPTFSIDLVNRQPWHKWVASNDLVIINMCRPPELLTRVFIGLVEDCRRRVVVDNNSVQRVITVTGRGLAKAFLRFDVGVVPEAEYQSTTTGWLESIGIVLAGSTPGAIVSAIWSKICLPHIKYKWNDGRNLFDYAKLEIKDRTNLKLLDSTTIMNWQGSINALIKDVAEEPFYEAFWEIPADAPDGYPAYVLRPTPFNPNDWNALDIYNITDDDVVSEEIGRSDVETYTIFSVGAKTLFSPEDTYKTFGVLPYWYKPYADKYGNNRLHVETSYTSVSDSLDVPLQTDTMRSLMVDLYNWNIRNNAMRNGTFIVKGSNRYKIGGRLLYTSNEDGSQIEYYITSVSHNFVNFDKYTTILGVTRGLDPKDRFSAPWDKYTEYSGMGIIPFNPVEARKAMNLDGNGDADGIDFEGANKVVSGAKDVMNHGINSVPVKYTFGANDPYKGKLDCSSFTEYIYNTYAGVELGRSTGQQVLKGSQVSKDKMLPGDLVFFKGTYASPHIYGVSHVGIYIGDNKFISNTSSGNISIDELSNSYWSAHWLMGRRVLTDSQLSSGKGETYSATAYGASAVNLMGGAGWVPTGKTATGTRPVEGRTIAVDKKVIPLYSKVHIESDYPGITGDYIAEDVGGAIKGKKIDIYFDDLPPADAYSARQRMLKFGKRDVKVTILRSGKG